MEMLLVDAPARTYKEAVLDLSENGMHVVLLHEQEKRPIRKGWPDKPASDLDIVLHDGGFGWVPGVSGYAVLDLDKTAPDFDLQDFIEDYPPAAVVESSSGKWHLVYRDPEKPKVIFRSGKWREDPDGEERRPNRNGRAYPALGILSSDLRADRGQCRIIEEHVEVYAALFEGEAGGITFSELDRVLS